MILIGVSDVADTFKVAGRNGGRKRKFLPVNQVSHFHQSSLFFDKLIELIPAKFYLPTDEKDKPWFPGLSKGAKASAKERKQGKTSRKARHTIGLTLRSLLQTTLDLLLRQPFGEGKIKPPSESVWCCSARSFQ
ncbi:hypothetical protein NC651_023990 [Populus alba x Populus x berolinensis]|nr:hypothetical protein NC651_023990 [Populus alba x Populus x berolinensis]